MQHIQITRGPITHITMTRAELHNAFNENMIQEIKSAFEKISNDLNARVVILQAEGSSFSAGADLNWMKKMIDYSKEQNEADSQELYAMLDSIRNCAIPTICRVQGSALGGGCGLVAATDMAFGVLGAKFGFTEVKLGLVPAVISPFVRDKIGLNHCRRFFFTGERFDALTAQNIGLLNQVFDSESEMDQLIESICNNIIGSSPAAVRRAKQLIAAIDLESTEKCRDFVCSSIAEARVSSEGQKGIKGFLSKQPVDWSAC